MKKPKKRIKKNVWENWCGYIGNKKVVLFTETKENTAEHNAEKWLKK